LIDWQKGDGQALEQLLPIVYQELRVLARKYLRQERKNHTLQATALIHEAYLRLQGQQMPEWKGRAHFFGVAAHLMRQILVDHARKHRSARRGGSREIVQLDEKLVFTSQRPAEFLDFDQALNDLAAFDPRKSRVLELRYFGGLNHEECAEVLNVSVGTVRNDLRLAQAWLRKQLAPHPTATPRPAE
jgi:RNA polymerase sigma factor (TIGR02999 family)